MGRNFHVKGRNFDFWPFNPPMRLSDMTILLLLALTDPEASDAPNPKVKPTEPLRANSYPSADAAVSAEIRFGVVLATPKRRLDGGLSP